MGFILKNFWVFFIIFVVLISITILFFSRSSNDGTNPYSFQKLTLFFFFMLYVIILIFVSIILNKSNSSQKWPPVINQCPDYWVAVDPTNNINNMYGDNIKSDVCVNVKKLGKCNSKNNDPYSIMDFNVSEFQGVSGNCAKYNWAKNCDLTWDGITYGISTPPCVLEYQNNL